MCSILDTNSVKPCIEKTSMLSIKCVKLLYDLLEQYTHNQVELAAEQQSIEAKDVVKRNRELFFETRLSKVSKEVMNEFYKAYKPDFEIFNYPPP